MTSTAAASSSTRSTPIRPPRGSRLLCFFCNDTATTEIYPLSLHDALPISPTTAWAFFAAARYSRFAGSTSGPTGVPWPTRSEEHTSELQSRLHLVCRLLLEKKKKPKTELRHNKKHKNQQKQYKH